MLCNETYHNIQKSFGLPNRSNDSDERFRVETSFELFEENIF